MTRRWLFVAARLQEDATRLVDVVDLVAQMRAELGGNEKTAREDVRAAAHRLGWTQEKKRGRLYLVPPAFVDEDAQGGPQETERERSVTKTLRAYLRRGFVEKKGESVPHKAVLEYLAQETGAGNDECMRYLHRGRDRRGEWTGSPLEGWRYNPAYDELRAVKALTRGPARSTAPSDPRLVSPEVQRLQEIADAKLASEILGAKPARAGGE